MKPLRMVVLALLLVAAGSNGWSAPKAQPDFLIVPGKRIGPARIGAGSRTLDVAFGAGESDESMGRGLCWWPPDSKIGLPTAPYFTVLATRNAAGTSKDHYLRTIRVTSHQYATARGISIRSPLPDIWRAFPKLRWDSENEGDKEGVLDTYVDDAQGIAFQIRRNVEQGKPRCYGIEVFRPKDEPFSMPAMTPND